MERLELHHCSELREIHGSIGHFAKNFPLTPRGKSNMIQQIETIAKISFQDHDAESLFSLNDEPTEETMFAVKVFSDSSESNSVNSITELKLMAELSSAPY